MCFLSAFIAVLKFYERDFSASSLAQDTLIFSWISLVKVQNSIKFLVLTGTNKIGPSGDTVFFLIETL